MDSMAGMFRAAVALGVVFILGTGNSSAQTGSGAGNSGCVLTEVGGTGRQVLKCRGGLTITAERGARYTLLDRSRDGIVDAVRARSKAILLDAPKAPGGFVVDTPQAIAAVRGTRWAVDVSAGKTAVFVVRGAVSVRRLVNRAEVVLGPGEGVDVDESSDALVVKRWPRPRVNALMARLGQ
jgi:ferric-dicitrate binding protein FerR (iron transport regulator)